MYYKDLDYAYLMIDQPVPAIKALDLSFNALKSSGEIAWYRALAYLKLKEIDQTLLQLELVMHMVVSIKKRY